MNFTGINRKGILFIISAPSGTGKTTLCNKLINICFGLKMSVSYTTRNPRQGEIDGKHYFFIKEDIFNEMISKGEFVEWARVHDNLYGTSKVKIDEMIMQGIDVLLDIDVQGGKQIKENIPDSVMIFILPPSMEVLKERLKNRMSDSQDSIFRRIGRARDEINEYTHYEYVIVNNTLKDALSELKSIIFAERAKVSRADHNWITKNFL